MRCCLSVHGGRESECALCLEPNVHPCLACTDRPVSGHTHECSRNAHAHPIRWSAWRFPRTARTAAAGRNGATATGRCAPWDGSAWRSAAGGRSTAARRGTPWDGAAWRSAAAAAAAAAAAGIGPGRVIVRVVGARHRFGLLSSCAYCHELLSWSLFLERTDDSRLLLLVVWVLALNCLTLLPIVSRLLKAWCLRAVFSMAKSLLGGVLIRSTACACVLSPLPCTLCKYIRCRWIYAPSPFFVEMIRRASFVRGRSCSCRKSVAMSVPSPLGYASSLCDILDHPCCYTLVGMT